MRRMFFSVLLMTAFRLLAADEVLFVTGGGVTSVVEVAGWTATLDGASVSLKRGERACGPHVFSGGWVFEGLDWGKRRRAVLSASVDVPAAGELAMGISADWFFDLYLDGRKVYSTGAEGNGTSEFAYWNHTVRSPVGAGRHALRVELVNGLGGMMFALGRPESKPCRASRPVTCEEVLAACRRLWARDNPFVRDDPCRLADLDVYQRAIDMTSGAALMAFCRGEKPDFAAAPALLILDRAVDRVLDEVRRIKVEPGSIALWYLYDMGFVVKTPKTTFGIDISLPRDAEIAELCDFACVTHNHEDHCSQRFVNAMMREGGFNTGKPVVSGFLYTKQHSRTPKTWRFGDCTVETGVTDHNPYWKESMTPVRVTCGEGPDAVVLLHAGDGWDADQLARFRPVDIAICHVWPWDGHNGEKTAQVLKPDLLVLSHAQELSHGFGPGRFDYKATEAEAARVRDARRTIFPVWGEKIVYRKGDSR